MKFRSLNRKPVEGNPNTWIQEPSAGLLSSFSTKLSEFPRLPGEGDRISTVLFTGGRILCCLFDGEESPKTLSLASIANDLHSRNPEEWPVKLLETDTARQVLDALDTTYFVRIIEWFIDQLPAGEFAGLQDAIREVWPELEKKGNA